MFFYKCILELINNQTKLMKMNIKYKKILLSLIGISCTTVFANRIEGAYQRQKLLEEKLNKMTEDQNLEYLRNKANDKADMWQRKINKKNDSFQKEELRKLSKVMKKNPEKDFTDFKKGIVKQNISLIKEESEDELDQTNEKQKEADFLRQRSFGEKTTDLKKYDGENSTDDSEDDDFIQKFEKNHKQSGVSHLFKQPEIPASMKMVRIRSSGSTVSKENNSLFGQDSVPLSMTQSKIFKWEDTKFYDSDGNYGVTKEDLVNQNFYTQTIRK
ncbi:MAG: hypothetical protein BGO07_02990 [Alphaproteobacteria bacterium 40-19]|nr:MAG: hypothetical protein BGO07_02990 [Alphaproteobacteria bacterium 40-19]